MIGLGLRLATRGRAAAVRLAVMSLGVGVGVALLVGALSLEPAMRMRTGREAPRSESGLHARPPARADTSALLRAVNRNPYRGQEVVTISVAGMGDAPPVPPGFPRLPRPDEVFASSALATLLDQPNGELLRDRFPGTVTALLGDEALVYPGELVAAVGWEPEALLSTGQSTFLTEVPSRPAPGPPFTPLQRLAVAVGSAGVLLPIVVFIGVMTRLGAAQRERRLAAIRLAGATPSQVRGLAAVEAALVGGLGSVLGLGLFFVLRPVAARGVVGGLRWFPQDLGPSPGMAVVLVLVVPLAAAAGAALSLRGVVTSPLGVARQARRRTPGARRMVVLLVGLGGLVAVLVARDHLSPDRQTQLAAASFVAIIVGIMVLGPWLTAHTASVAIRRARRAGTLLAARRLHADPAAGFRASSGLVLAVFVAAVFHTFAPALVAGANLAGNSEGGSDVVVSLWGDANTTNATPTLVQAVDGVEEVVATRWGWGSEQGGTGEVEGGVPVLVAECAQLNRALDAKLSPCPGPGVYAVDVDTAPGSTVALQVEPTFGSVEAGAEASIEIPEAGLGTVTRPESWPYGPTLVVEPERLAPDLVAALGVRELLVGTDGSTEATERVRNTVLRRLPGSDVRTDEDVHSHFGRDIANIRHLLDAALLLILAVASLSLAASAVGGILERRRPFALLRAAGMAPRELRRVTFIETTLPLALTTVVSAVLGVGVATALLSVERGTPISIPVLSLGAVVALGLLMAVVVVILSLGVLERATRLDAVRTE